MAEAGIVSFVISFSSVESFGPPKDRWRSVEVLLWSLASVVES